jgi:hypothetical protein
MSSFRFRAFPILLIGVFAFNGAHALAAEQVHVSNNWAGQEAVGGTFTGVSATWTVPGTSKSSSRISAHTEWVGIGGAQTSDLVQAGTQAIKIRDKTVYVAWYETLPDAQRELPLKVEPGDTVSVSLTETAPDLWHLSFKNITQGTSYVADIPYHSSHSSAEWIVERPLAIDGTKERYLALNDFDSVTFSNATAIVDGVQRDLSDLTTERVILKGNTSSTVSAVPTALKKDGTFAVSYYTAAEGRAYLRKFRKVYRPVPIKEKAVVAPIAIPATGTTVIHFSF